MVAHAMATYGRIDFTANNACIEGQVAGVTELSEENWGDVIDTNLKGTFLCHKYEAKAMLASGFGESIVNVGAVYSSPDFAGGVGYCASKHGQIGLTMSASVELAPQGICVNLVCPGIVDTPMYQQPQEIAKTIVLLCSDDANCITGTTMTPDVGLVRA